MTDTRATKVVILRDNDLANDTRARKIVASLVRLGMDVTVVCRSSGSPEVVTIAGAEVRRVSVPFRLSRTVNESHKSRRDWRPRLSRRPANQAQLAYKVRATAGDIAVHRGRVTRARQDKDAALLATELLGSARAGLAYRVMKRMVVLDKRRVQGEEWAVAQVGQLWPRWDQLLDELRIKGQLPVPWRRGVPMLRDLDLVWAPLIDALAPDVIHAHDAPVLHVAVRAADRARLVGRRVPVIYDAIEYWPGLPDLPSNPRWFYGIVDAERTHARDVSGAFAVSAPIADKLKADHGWKHVPSLVLNVPVNIGAPRAPGGGVRSAAGVAEDTALLVYAGGIALGRGVETIVDALPLLPGVHLAVAPVPFPHKASYELMARAVRLGVADRVHIVRPSSPQEVINFLSTADVGVHPLEPGSPNHDMALPNKVFEYGHAGLAVVVSNCAEMERLVLADGIGQSYRYGDPVDLAGAVTRALAARGVGPQASERVVAARQAWRSARSWQAQEASLAEVYGRVLGRQFTVPAPEVPFPDLSDQPILGQP